MEALPADCLACILWLMTPEEACRLAAVSKTLRSMVNSNVVWRQLFLPEGWEYEVSNAREPSPQVLAALSSKDLFVRLYRHGVHVFHRSIDEGIVLYTYIDDGAMVYFGGMIFVTGTWEFNFESITDDPLSYLLVSDEVKCSLDYRPMDPLDVRTLTLERMYAIYFVFDLKYININPSENVSEIIFQNPVQLRFYLSFGRMVQEKQEVILVLDPQLKNFEERADGRLEVEMIKFIKLTKFSSPYPSSILISYSLEERPPHNIMSYSFGFKKLEVRPILDV